MSAETERLLELSVDENGDRLERAARTARQLRPRDIGESTWDMIVLAAWETMPDHLRTIDRKVFDVIYAHGFDVGRAWQIEGGSQP